MDDNTFDIIEDKLTNSETGDIVTGIRIMIKGKFKEKIDKKKLQNSSYADEIGKMIGNGITKIITEIKKN